MFSYPDCPSELVALSRELGGDPHVVLHGGGNTSCKTTVQDIDGSEVDVLWMKGSGRDLGEADPDTFAPLRLARLRQLLPPVVVPDDALLNELRCALLRADAADPSVETLVHALFPQKWVLHSHPDVLLAHTHAPGARERLSQLLGDRVAVVDYAMPGPDLVAGMAEVVRADGEQAVIVLNHGLFVAADDGSVARALHDEILTSLQESLPAVGSVPQIDVGPVDAAGVVSLRAAVSDLAGRPMIAHVQRDPEIMARLADEDLLAATQAGPLTPDHVTWTKPWPLIGTDVAAWAERYEAYVTANSSRRDSVTEPLDPAPRVALDADLGLVTFGRTAAEARAAGDIARHTLAAISLAQSMGGYEPVGDGHVFDLEYWTVQQQKSRRKVLRPKAGRVALVTGAASGIGKACARALLDDGACVVGWDLSPSVAETFDDPNYLGVAVDVTDGVAMARGLDQAVEAFGGVDILVVAAGIFPSAAHLDELDMVTWRKVMAVNVDAVTELFGLVAPHLQQAPGHGQVVVIASKNVAAPGPGAAAYSASKAALTQLCRVAALEWAGAGVRVNMVHPDAVFDTGLWTPELLAARAEHYGMSVDDYKRRNLLHTEITSHDVGRLTAAMAGPLFACTTGAQVPIDGGSDRII